MQSPTGCYTHMAEPHHSAFRDVEVSCLDWHGVKTYGILRIGIKFGLDDCEVTDDQADVYVRVGSQWMVSVSWSASQPFIQYSM